MKKTISIISCLALLAGCDSATKPAKQTEVPKEQISKTLSPVDTTPMVTGIGGVFFASDNPKDMKEWYTKNLGLKINAWGSAGFEFRNLNRPDEVGTLQWKPFNKEADYFAPSKKDFMINYRVQNITGMVNRLKANGVTILDSIATYDFGKFVHIMDNEGNKLELWEPVDSVASLTATHPNK